MNDKPKRFRVYYRWPGEVWESYLTVCAKNEEEAHAIFLRVTMSPEEAQRVIVTRVAVAPKE